MVLKNQTTFQIVMKAILGSMLNKKIGEGFTNTKISVKVD